MRKSILTIVMLVLLLTMMVGCGGDKVKESVAHQDKPKVKTQSVKNIPSVWVINNDLMDSAIYQIDPTTNKQIAKIPFDGAPYGIAVSQEAIWVTDFANDKVVRIDPATHKTVASIKVGKSPNPITISPGAVWVANTTDGTVSRIDTASNQVTDTIKVTDVMVNSLCFADNAIWAGTVDFGVSKIDLSSNKMVARINVGTVPSGIAGDSGVLWVGAPVANQLLRVDTRTQTVSTSIDTGNTGAPVLIPDMVAAANYKEGTVALVKTADNTPAESFKVANNLSSLTYGMGSLWATSENDNTLYRIDPKGKSVVAKISIKLAWKVAVSPE